MKYEDIGVTENKIEVPNYTVNEEKTYLSNQSTFAEPEPESMSLNILQNNLGNCLRIIDDEVMKGYVTRLDQLPIIIQDEETYDSLNDMHFFKISELVYQEDEFSVDKLAMVFHALANKPCTLVLMLRSDGEKTDFRLLAFGDKVADDYVQTTQSAKRFAFPKAEKLFSYRKEGKDVTLQERDLNDFSEIVLWKVRPCDAAGFAPLTGIFNWDYKDNIYNARRD